MDDSEFQRLLWRLDYSTTRLKRVKWWQKILRLPSYRAAVLDLSHTLDMAGKVSDRLTPEQLITFMPVLAKASIVAFMERI